MKGLTLVKVAVATGLVAGATLPGVARAEHESDSIMVRYSLKGAEGAGFMKARRNDNLPRERRESVAGFRVESDAQGQQWVYKRYMLKGAEGTGFMRVPLPGAEPRAK